MQRSGVQALLCAIYFAGTLVNIENVTKSNRAQTGLGQITFVMKNQLYKLSVESVWTARTPLGIHGQLGVCAESVRIRWGTVKYWVVCRYREA